MLSEQQISALPDPAERIWHRCTQALHGRATVTATVTHRGGGMIARTTEYSASAIGPDVLAEVKVTDNVEWRLQGDLAAAYKIARRLRDLDVFKREVQQRSGQAITAGLAQHWADNLRPLPYPQYVSQRAAYMAQAVSQHPGQ